MAENRIRIAYDGEALRSGTMDVRDLAPALMALSDLFDEANKVLNGKDSTIELRVQPDVRIGSFDIGVQVVQPFVRQMLQLFSGDQASGLANLIEILGFTVGVPIGLIALVKRIRGRKVRRMVLMDDGRTRLILEGDEHGEEIVISRQLAVVFNDLAVRRALAKLLEPLRRDGIDKFEARTQDGEVIETVVRDDLQSFEPPPPAQAVAVKVLKHEFEQAFSLVSVVFKDGNKWRVSDGQNTINVTIADEAFLAKVNARDITFAKDDTIVCKIRQEQTIGADGALKIESTVLQVLDHQRAPRQTVIQFPPPSDDDPFTR
ncbi:MAG TPA: hypothetical protein VHE30_23760 [Polyangiaceae bacterium]|nr:hypothetical protein [Polyangiaceae bacterium]